MADKSVVTKPAGRALLAAVENAQLRKDVPEIQSGDTVRLQVRVVEGNRERLQPFVALRRERQKRLARRANLSSLLRPLRGRRSSTIRRSHCVSRAH